VVNLYLRYFWIVLITAILAMGNGCLVKSGFENSVLNSENRQSLSNNPDPTNDNNPNSETPIAIPPPAPSPTADVVDAPPPTSFKAPDTPLSIPDLQSLPFKNPCHTSQKWKNWMTDTSSVTINTGAGDITLDLPDESRRSTIENINLSYDRALKITQRSDNNTGFFYDVYVTNDNAHTVPGPNYTDPFNGQMFLDHLANLIKIGRNTSLTERMKAGTAFTSQSTTGMGHSLLSDSYQVNENECNFLYIGAVRAGPAYLSYQSGRENRRLIQYDGLQSYMYNSVGQSGSELPAIGKMGIAAATLNPKVKSEKFQDSCRV
jgi:hypothetical protein